MNPRTTALLALIVIGVGCFIYFYEIGGEAKRQAALDEAKRVFTGLSEGDIDAVALQTQDGVDARFERKEGRWEVVSPLKDRADTAALDAMASALAHLTRQGTVADPGDPSQYGMGSDAKIVRFEVGGKEEGLRIGRATPVGGRVYVTRLGDDQIDYVDAFRINAFKRNFDDLRDRRIFGFDAADVETLRVSWVNSDSGSQNEVALARRDAGGWQMGVPVDTRADEQTVREVLGDLSFLRAKGFVDKRSPEVDAALAKPWITIHWTLRGDHLERVATFAGMLGGDRLIETGAGRLYTIDVSRAKDFERTIADYRYKMLSEFEVSSARRLTLDFAPSGAADEPMHVVADLTGEGWSSENPSIDPARASDLVETLSSLRADDIFAEEMGPNELKSLGLAPPLVAIRVDQEVEPAAQTHALAEVAIGRLDAKRGLFVQRVGEPTIYLLSAEHAKALPISREVFARDFEAKPADAQTATGEELDPDELATDPLEGVEAP